MSDSVSSENEEREEGNTPSSGPRKSPAVALLSRKKLWLCFALSILVFLFTGGPIWLHPWHINASAFWSYAVIPPLVFACLLWERNVTLVAFGLGTMETTIWKFGATYVLAHGIWMLVPPPPDPPKAPQPVAASAPPVAAVLPTPIDPRTTGTVDGVVTNAGRAVADALVVVEGGLEAYTFAPPERPITLVDENGALAPSLQVVEAGQEVRARSGDRLLHTVVATIEDTDLFSIPLQSSGAWTTIRVTGGKGIATLHCGVHQHSLETARLIVTDNPFYARTSESGHFRFAGVPAGRVRVLVIASDGQTSGAASVVVEPLRESSLPISL